MEAEAARAAAAGIYPVDILEDDPERHWEAALAYYTTLREGMRPPVEFFSLPTGEQVKLEATSVCFCTVHRDEPQHKILVLVNPQDTKTVVAVYIKEFWWPTEDVLRTSDPAREGLMKVQSFGERIVLFILNVVIFGRLERNLDDGDMFFLPHSVKEQAKILWQDGAAVGFYTTKRKGSLCGDGTGACYLLPVFDTVFVRRTYRRQGLGMAMLQDFCETFREDEALGVSWPISPAMYQVCRKFLEAHPEERGRLWEVEPPGAWGQRGSIWLKVRQQQAQLPDSHPGNSKEDMSHHGRTSPDDGPRPSQDDKKERTSGEPEKTKSDQDCGVKEAAVGRLRPARWAEPEEKEAKRTVMDVGLAWESQQKHMRPSS
ncbi:protein FAM169B isoform X1 [Vulpes vulpes]|uniref:Protein FAM169B isoform X1 n=1 Tax=Vulpes vulpes TaxID=9627 RepID=A0ABM4YSL9_VULVU